VKNNEKPGMVADTCTSSYCRGKGRSSRPAQGQLASQKQNPDERVGGIGQMVECFRQEALDSTPGKSNNNNRKGA
jgi:hypothetical protein